MQQQAYHCPRCRSLYMADASFCRICGLKRTVEDSRRVSVVYVTPTPDEMYMGDDCDEHSSFNATPGILRRTRMSSNHSEAAYFRSSEADGFSQSKPRKNSHIVFGFNTSHDSDQYRTGRASLESEADFTMNRSSTGGNSYKMRQAWASAIDRPHSPHLLRGISMAKDTSRPDLNMLDSETSDDESWFNGYCKGFWLSEKMVLHPNNTFRLIWNLLCTSLIIYDIFYVPLQGAFRLPPSIVIVVQEWFSTIYWTLDIPVSFSTGYFAGSELEMRPFEIAKHYLKTWLALDILVVLTEWMSRLDVIMTGGFWNLMKANKFIKQLKMLKLLRLAKMRNMLAGIELRLSSTIFLLCWSIFKLTMLIFFMVHLVTCMWYWTGTHTDAGWTSYELTCTEDVDYESNSCANMVYHEVTNYGEACASSQLITTVRECGAAARNLGYLHPGEKLREYCVAAAVGGILGGCRAWQDSNNLDSNSTLGSAFWCDYDVDYGYLSAKTTHIEYMSLCFAQTLMTRVEFWYFASMRWTLAQINGRTDMDPRRNMIERAYTCMVALFIAIIVMACFTSGITTTMMQLAALADKKNSTMRLVIEFLERRRIPAKLVVSLKRHLNENQSLEDEHAKEQTILEMLPKQLANDIMHEIRSPLLTQHQLFLAINNDNPRAIRHLSHAVCIPMFVHKFEVIFDTHDACNRMLIIDKGNMKYTLAHVPSICKSMSDEELPAPCRTWTGSPQPLNDNDEFIRKEEFICEAALWVFWNNAGRLTAVSHASLLNLEATEFAEAIKEHMASFQMSVVYAKAFHQEIETQEVPTDLWSPPITSMAYAADAR